MSDAGVNLSGGINFYLKFQSRFAEDQLKRNLIYLGFSVDQLKPSTLTITTMITISTITFDIDMESQSEVT